MIQIDLIRKTLQLISNRTGIFHTWIHIAGTMALLASWFLHTCEAYLRICNQLEGKNKIHSFFANLLHEKKKKIYIERLNPSEDIDNRILQFDWLTVITAQKMKFWLCSLFYPTSNIALLITLFRGPSKGFGMSEWTHLKRTSVFFSYIPICMKNSKINHHLL